LPALCKCTITAIRVPDAARHAVTRRTARGAAPRPGHDVAAGTTKRKREDAENILPYLADLLAPLEPGSHPHPSLRDDQTVWRHLCTNCAENPKIIRRRPMRSTLRRPPRLRQPH